MFYLHTGHIETGAYNMTTIRLLLACTVLLFVGICSSTIMEGIVAQKEMVMYSSKNKMHYIHCCCFQHPALLGTLLEETSRFLWLDHTP
jgi:hypothetical protein